MTNPSNRATIQSKAEDIVTDVDPYYLNNWFSATGFFSDTYMTGVIRDCYFITKSDFMNSEIYAARFMTTHGIITLENAEGDRALDTLEEAKSLIQAHYKASKK